MICFKFSNPLANSLLVSVRGTLVGQSGNAEPVARGYPAPGTLPVALLPS